MKTYPHIRRALSGKLWYVEPRKMEEILAVLELRLSGGAAAPEVLESIRAGNVEAAARAKASAGSGAIAVIPIYGMIMHRTMYDMSGGSAGTSCSAISTALQAAMADPNVGSIVLDIDSPGGDVDGVDELAAEILQARKQKKITAVSNCLCASAAYYLAAQATEIVVSPSSLTGSIGVYTMHEDDSAMLDAMGVKLELIKYGENKAEGNSLGPLSDSARAHLQEMVDTYGIAFEKAVARGRNVKQDLVHSKFGQGRVFDAKTAVKIGMADRVGTLAEVLGQSGTGKNAGNSRAVAQAEEFEPEIVHAAADGTVTIPAAGSYTVVMSAIAKAAQANRAAADRVPNSSAEPVQVHIDARGPRSPEEVAAIVAKHAALFAGLGEIKGGVVPPAVQADDGDGDGSDCECDCIPCDGGDCDDCDHDDCACEGCTCDSAMAAKAKIGAQAEEELTKVRARGFDRMRHELSQAAAR
jgi:signal peptide peptidase SppA